MPRPRLCRRISFNPDVTFFKPAGVRLSELEEVNLTLDELEALRLKDFKQLSQLDCAKKMSVSQPTFHRLLLDARRKVSEALIEGKAIKVEGGNYKF
ncbi:MAG: DUF134 domain-containing protein [archaeon]